MKHNQLHFSVSELVTISTGHMPYTQFIDCATQYFCSLLMAEVSPSLNLASHHKDTRDGGLDPHDPKLSTRGQLLAVPTTGKQRVPGIHYI
jgi:hypothetical protein